MRAGSLRVFDGLRLTTEHFDHLQSAIHMSLRDVRQVLGLGKAYSGFEVERAGEGSVLIRPGFAFDFERNQIVSDEPKTLEITFDDSQDTLYVCVAYDQVTTDPVEGKPTLVWDSCSFVTRSDLPSSKDNQVPIARLQRLPGESSGFDFIPLKNGTDSLPLSSPSFDALSAAPRAAAVKGQAVDSTVVTAAPVAGIIQCSGQLDQQKLFDQISRNPVGNGTLIQNERRLTIEQRQLAIPSTYPNVSINLIVEGEITISALSASGDASNASPTATPQTISLQVTGSAEVVRQTPVRQYSISAGQLTAQTQTGPKTCFASDVSENALLIFRFSRTRQLEELLVDNSILEFLDHVTFLVTATGSDEEPLDLAYSVAWDENLSGPMPAFNFGFTWKANLLWKVAP